jgi:hypothetical protein
MKNLIKKEKHQKQTKDIGLFTVNCTVQSTVKGIKKGKKTKGKKKKLTGLKEKNL